MAFAALLLALGLASAAHAQSSQPTVTVSGGPGVVEGNHVVFTLAVAPAPAAALSVAVRLDGSAYLTGTSPRTITVTVAAGSTTMAFSAATADDSNMEAPAPVTAAVQAGTGYTVGTAATASVTVTSNDPVTYTVNVGIQTPGGANIAHAAEGDQIIVLFTVSPAVLATGVENEMDGSLEIHYTATGAEAKVPPQRRSHGGASLPILVAAGQSTVSFPVDIIDNNINDGNQTYTVALRSPPTNSQTGVTVDSGYMLGVGLQAEVLITDNDTTQGGTDPTSATVNLAPWAADARVLEGEVAIFALSVSPRQQADLPVAVALQGSGVAGLASDLTLTVGGGSVNIPTVDLAASTAVTVTVTVKAGEASARLSVHTQGNNIDQMDAEIRATLAGTGYTMGTLSAATVAVLDDEVPELGLTVNVQSGASVNEGARLEFQLVADLAPWRDLSVGLILAEQGTFINRQDYETVTPTMTFLPRLPVVVQSVMVLPAGQTVVNFSVATVDDTRDEASGVVSATLTGRDGYSLGSNARLTVEVRDNDPALVSINAVTRGTIVEGQDAVFQISAAQAHAEVTIRVQVDDTGSFIDGTSPATVSVVLMEGQSRVLLTVMTQDDAVSEATGYITATLQSGGGSDYTRASPQSAVVAVADNEIPAASIWALDTGIDEGQSARFEVRVLVPGDEVAINVLVDEPGDFLAAGASSVTVTVAAGESVASFSVPTDADSQDEPHGYVIATVQPDSANPQTYTVGRPSAASVLVRDDDPVGATISSAVANENDRDQVLRFRVRLITPAETALTFRASAVSLGDDTAEPGLDYFPLTDHEVRFDIGAQEREVLVGVLDDRENEAEEESMTLVLVDATGATVATGSGHILDDETDPPRLSLSVTPSSPVVTEGTDLEFVVTASGYVARALAHRGAATKLVSLASSGYVARALAVSVRIDSIQGDYLTLPAPGTQVLTILEGASTATLTVRTADDTIVEPDGIIGGELLSGSGFSLSPGRNIVRVAMTSNDLQRYQVTPSAVYARVAEGDDALFVITAEPAVNNLNGLPVRFQVDGAITQLSFTVPSTRSVTIPRGQQSVTVTVQTISNSGIGDNGEVRLKVLPGDFTYLSYRPPAAPADQSSVAIINTVPISGLVASVRPMEAEIDEGQQARFRIALSAVTSKSLTVNFQVEDADGRLVSTAPSQVVIDIGRRSARLNLQTYSDSVLTPASQIVVTLQEGDGYILTIGADAGVTATVTVRSEITEPPPPPPPQGLPLLRISGIGPIVDGRLQVMEGDDVVVVFRAGSPPTSDLKIPINVTRGASTKLASPAQPSEVVLPMNRVSVVLTIKTTQDNSYGTDGTFVVGLDTPVPAGYALDTDNDRVPVTVLEDEGPLVTVHDAGAIEGEQLIFIVSMYPLPLKPVMMRYETANADRGQGNLAEPRADYKRVRSGILTFLPGNTTKFGAVTQRVIRLNTRVDDLDEGEEKMRLVLTKIPGYPVALFDQKKLYSNVEDGNRGAVETIDWVEIDRNRTAVRTESGHAHETPRYRLSANSIYATGSIFDSTLTADRMPRLTIEPVLPETADVEEGMPAEFVITRTTIRLREQTQMTVQLLVAPSSYATAGPIQFTLAQGQSNATLSLNTLDDDQDDGPTRGSVVVALRQAPSLYVLNEPFSATAFVTDNDPNDLMILAGPDVDEGDPATFTIRSTFPATEDLTVAVSLLADGDGRIIGTDPSMVTVVLTTGSQEVNLSVQTRISQQNSPSVTVMANLQASSASPATYRRTAQAQASLLVRDTSTPRAIGTDVSVSEGAGEVRFVVTLTAPELVQIFVDYATASGTAIGIEDYVSTAGMLVFPPGETLKTVTVSLVDDDLNEPDETFQLNMRVSTMVSDRTTGTFTTPVSPVATIVDDDPASITIRPLSPGQVVRQGESAVFILSASETSPEDVIVNLRAASVGGHLAARNETVTLAAGETTASLTLTTNNAGSAQGGDVTATLVAGAGYTLGSPVAATLAVSVLPTLTLTTFSGFDTVNEGALSLNAGARFLLMASPFSTSELQVRLLLSSTGSYLPGGAASAVTVVTLAANDGSIVINIPIDDDNVDADDPSLNLGDRLTMEVAPPQATDRYVRGVPRAAFAVVSDNDVSASVLDGGTLREDSGMMHFRVELSSPFASTVRLRAFTSDGSAVAGTDYTAVNTMLTFNPNVTVRSVAVALSDDTATEGQENFYLLLDSPTPANQVHLAADASRAEGVILDDDQQSLRVPDRSVAEDTRFSFTVQLVADPTTTVTVSVSTADGTATAGQDYVALTNHMLTFTPGGALQQPVWVGLINDQDVEGPETFTLTATLGSDSTVSATGTATILSDDELRLEVHDGAGSEDASRREVVFAVFLTANPSGTFLVDVNTADGSARAGQDYQALSGVTLTFASGDLQRSVTVAVMDDDLDEQTETFTLSLAQRGGAMRATATGYIRDNDATARPARVSLDKRPIAAAYVTEGDAAEFTVYLDSALAEPLTVEVDVEATGGYTTGALPNRVTIAAGETTATLTVATEDDNQDRPDGSVTVRLADGAGYIYGHDSISRLVTVRDNDVEVSVADVGAVSESASPAEVEFSVSLSSAFADPVTVIVSTSDGTAMAPADYTGVTMTLTFAANELHKTVTVPLAAPDDLPEEDKGFSLRVDSTSLMPTGQVHVARGEGQAVIIDDDHTILSIEAVAKLPINEGATATFTINAQAATEVALTVNLTVTLLSGIDFLDAANPPAMTAEIPMGSDTVNYTFATSADSSYQPADSVYEVRLLPGTGYTLLDGLARATVVVTNDYVIHVEDAIANEGEPLEFRVTLLDDTLAKGGQPVQAPKRLVWTYQVSIEADDTGERADIFDPFVLGKVIFEVGASTAVITLYTDPDADQQDETLTLTITDKIPEVGRVVNVLGTAKAFIQDTEKPTLRIEVDRSPIHEGQTASFTIIPSHEVLEYLTVGLRVRAVNQDNFIAGGVGSLPTAVTIAPGPGPVKFTFATEDDITFTYRPGSAAVFGPRTESGTIELEHRSHYEVTLLGGPRYNLDGRNREAIVTVEDNENLLSVEVNRDTITEGQAVVVTVKSTPKPRGNLTVTLELSHVSGGESAGLPPSKGTMTTMVVLPFTADSVTFTLTTNDDFEHEDDGVYKLAFVTPPEGYYRQVLSIPYVIRHAQGITESPARDIFYYIPQPGKRMVMVTVRDDDQDPADLQVEVTPADQVVVEGGTAIFTVSFFYRGEQVGAPSGLTYRLGGAADANDFDAGLSGPLVGLSGELDFDSVTEGVFQYIDQNGNIITTGRRQGVGGKGDGYTPDPAVPTLPTKLLVAAVVTKLDKNDNEGDESFTFSVLDATSATLATASAAIRDDIFLSIEDGSGLESSGKVEFIVSLSSEPLVPVSALVTSMPGSATLGEDFQGIAQRIAFRPRSGLNPGQTERTITVAVMDDSTMENDETFTLRLANLTNAKARRLEATGTIVENEGGLRVSFAASQFEAAEGDGAAQLVFVVNIAPRPAFGQTFLVDYATVDAIPNAGTAAAAVPGRDYTATSGTLTLTRANPNPMVTVAISGDDEAEPPEALTLMLSNLRSPSGGPIDARLVNAQAQGIILDGDTHTVSFAADRVMVAEGAARETAELVFTVNVDPAPEANDTFSLRYATLRATGDTATPDQDFAGATGTLAFNAAAPSRMVTVTVNGDDDVEPTEWFTLRLFNLQGPGAAFVGRVNILDAAGVIENDDTSEVNFTQSRVVVQEGDAGTRDLAFTVVIDPPPVAGKVVTVNYTTMAATDNPATLGTDYTAASGRLTFRSMQVSRMVTVTVQGDLDIELDEQFILQLHNLQGDDVRLAGGAMTLDGTGVITNDDFFSVSFAATEVTVAEGAAGTTTELAFTVNIEPAPSAGETITMSYATTNRRGQMAAAGTDYTAAQGVLTFTATESSQMVTVMVRGDNDLERDEQFTLRLSNLQDPRVRFVNDLSVLDATAVISNDDYPTLVAVEAINDEVQEGGNDAVEFRISLSVPLERNLIVWFSVTGRVNFILGEVPNRVFIPAGETVTTLRLPVADDNVDEPDGSVTLTLEMEPPPLNSYGLAPEETLPSGRVIDRTTASVRVTDNDDVSSQLTVNLVPLSLTVAENYGRAAFMASVTPVPARDSVVTVDYTTVDNTARAIMDYTAAAGSLTFNSSTTSQLVLVTIVDDDLMEADEDFLLSLDNLQGAIFAGRGSTLDATVTILSDSRDLPIVTIVPTGGVTTIAEDAGVAASFDINVTPAVSMELVVSLTLHEDVGRIVGFTGDPRTDTVTIPANQSSVTYDRTINDDTFADLDSTLYAFVNQAPGYRLGQPRSASIVITEDDGMPALPTVRFGSLLSLWPESGGSVDFVVTIEPAPAVGTPVLVDYRTTSSTGQFQATAGDDYTAATGTLSFTTSVTSHVVSVFITDDDMVELEESLRLVLSNLQNGGNFSGGGTSLVAVARIVDNDQVALPTVSIAATVRTVTEAPGAMARFSVTANPALTGNETLTVALQVFETGSYIDGTLPSLVTLNSLGATFALPIEDDNRDERTGQVIAELRPDTGYRLAPPSNAATVTVHDDDSPPMISISAVRAVLVEAVGAMAQFTITADPPQPSGQPLMVEIWVTETRSYVSRSTPYRQILAVTGSATLNVPIASSDVIDITGIISAELRRGSGYTVPQNLDDRVAEVKVLDKDGTSKLSIAAVVPVVEEGPGAMAQFRIKADPALPIGETLTVAVMVTESGDFIDGTPPSLITVATDGATLNLPIDNDDVAELPGTVTARLADGTYYLLDENAREATVTVTDDEMPLEASIAATTRTVAEGIDAAAQFRVILDPPLPGGVPLQVVVAVTETGNYIGGTPPSLVTIVGGSVILNVPIEDDDVVEPDARVIVTLKRGPGYVVAAPPDDEASVVVVDSDGDGVPFELAREINQAVLPRVAIAVADQTGMLMSDRIKRGFGVSPAGVGGQASAASGREGLLVKGTGLTEFLKRQLPSERDARRNILEGQPNALGDADGGLGGEQDLNLLHGDYQFSTPYLYEAKRGYRVGGWNWTKPEFGIEDFEFSLSLGGEGSADRGVLGKILGGTDGTANGLSGDGGGSGSRFSQNPFTVWAKGYYTDVDSQEGDYALDSSIQGAMIGIDIRWREDLILGLGMSRSTADTDFSGKRSGVHETRMQAIHPYFGWKSSSDSHIWGNLSLGSGDLELLVDNERGRGRLAPYRRDIDWQSLSLGSHTLIGTDKADEFNLALIADGRLVRLGEDGAQGVSVNAARIRVGLELASKLSLAEFRDLSYEVELTGRRDFGDGAVGAGLEVGGNVDFALTDLGLRFDLGGRVLLGHSGSTQEWGLTGGMEWSRQTDGSGFALVFRPQWGIVQGKNAQLWDNGLEEQLGETLHPRGRGYELELKYGLPILGGDDVLNLFTGTNKHDQGNRIRLGFDFKLKETLSVEYEATTNSRTQDAVEHQIRLQYQRRF